MEDTHVYVKNYHCLYTKYKLKGMERDVFATILSYSLKNRPYTGGTKHICEMYGYSRERVQRTFKKLCDMKFIKRMPINYICTGKVPYTYEVNRELLTEIKYIIECGNNPYYK